MLLRTAEGEKVNAGGKKFSLGGLSLGGGLFKSGGKEPADVIASVGAALLWGALVLQPVFQHGLTGHLPPEEVLRQVGLLWRAALGTSPDREP